MTKVRLAIHWLCLPTDYPSGWNWK